jgi:8-oxo-dGTP diphosphatase
VIIFLYLCREWDGFIKPKENQNLKWVRPNELFEINMLPADTPLISFIRDNVS